MPTKIAAALVAGLPFVVPAILAAQPAPEAVTRSATVVMPCRPEARPGLYTVWFDDKAWQIVKPTDARITSETPIRLRIEGLNFFRYALTLDTKEEKSEAYQYLEKLFGSVVGGAGLLTLGGGAGAGADAAVEAVKKEDTLLFKVHKLYVASMALDREVASALEPFTGLNVTCKARTDLDPAKVNDALLAAGKAATDLQVAIEKDAEAFVEANGKSAKYVKIAGDAYRAATEKAGTFLTLVPLVRDGDERTIGPKAAGLRITTTVFATDRSGAKTFLADFNYVVQSKYPLVAHAGLTFSRLDEVSFKQVQRANGLSADDLFQQQDTGANTQDFTLFLGWEAYARSSRLADDHDRLSVMLSLGTSASEPGKKIFIGPSVMWRRFVVTIGAVIGKEADGVEQVQEPNLFKAVKESTSHALFGAFSVRLF